ncbi:MAG: NAD(P)H-dependent oxidoreductase [Bacteroidota bacterium]
MKKKIISFGASNSKRSINRQFARFAASQLSDVDVRNLDLNDFPLPLYSVDLEISDGIPSAAINFLEEVKAADGIVVSLAEYNGLHTSAFKNLWDWLSRVDGQQIWQNKPMLLLGTSPSQRQESNVMQVSKHLFPFFGANIIGAFHLPSFNHYFKENSIVNEEFKARFNIELNKFQAFINQQ